MLRGVGWIGDVCSDLNGGVKSLHRWQFIKCGAAGTIKLQLENTIHSIYAQYMLLTYPERK